MKHEIDKYKRKLEYAAEDGAKTAEQVAGADIWAQLLEALMWLGAFIAVVLLLLFCYVALKKD